MKREEDIYDRVYAPLESIDDARLSLRMYPHNNATSWSLQQYKDPINNGNDYNLYGENVGEGSTSVVEDVSIYDERKKIVDQTITELGAKIL